MASQFTPKQLKELEKARDIWTQVAISTEPANYGRALAAIYKLYDMAKVPRPPLHFFGTPMQCMLTIQGMKLNDLIDSKSVSKSKNVAIDDLPRTNSSLSQCFLGQNEADWVGFGRFFYDHVDKKEFSPEDVEKLEIWEDIAQSCGWWWPYDEAVFVADRPSELHWDNAEAPRLHRNGGPAVAYRDGWKIYFWHGVEIPPQWGSVDSSRWDPKWMLAEQNAEMKRILCEGMGYQKIVHGLDGKVIHRGKQTMNTLSGIQTRDMELVRIPDGDVEPMCLLKVMCPSTDHEYVLRVPPNTKTCEAALDYVNHGHREFVLET